MNRSFADKKSFEVALKKLEAAFDALKPELEYTVRDPESDVEGYVVVWSTKAASEGMLKGVGKGGTRITPQVTLDEIKMLARVMTLKNAAAGLPLGGAKSGLKADPKAPHFQSTYRKFVSLCKPILAERGGPFGGFGFDIGGEPVHALWACDELGSYRSFTGKPVELGGTDYDREGIAGLGVVEAAKTFTIEQGSSLKKCSCAVQGLGAMGGAVVRYLLEEGATIDAVADPRIGGTVVRQHFGDEHQWNLFLNLLAQLNIREAQKMLSEKRIVLEDSGAVLFHPCDILFPCAVQNVITEQNSSNIKARLVVEGANGPCTEVARQQLCSRGVPVIPDFIANPGGIIAAYVELTSNASLEENKLHRVNVHAAKKLTREKIAQNVQALYAWYASLGIDFVSGGKFLAYTRIFGDIV